jgi:hypothetical protein
MRTSNGPKTRVLGGPKNPAFGPPGTFQTVSVGNSVNKPCLECAKPHRVASYALVLEPTYYY